MPRKTYKSDREPKKKAAIHLNPIKRQAIKPSFQNWWREERLRLELDRHVVGILHPPNSHLLAHIQRRVIVHLSVVVHMRRRETLLRRRRQEIVGCMSPHCC